MEAHFHTPLENRLKSVFSATPSTGKTVTPLSTGRTTVTPVSPRFPGKRDIIHRLRQQLKSRDEMIMHMQSQVLEQSRLIHAHQLRIGDLEELLRTTNRSLFEAELEVDNLRKMLAESCTCRPAACQVRKRTCLCDGRQVAAAGVKGLPAQNKKLHHPVQDMAVLVAEARRLTIELKLATEAKQQKERDYLSLACELAEARELAQKNAALYEACEGERTKLRNVLTDLQSKLQSQAIKLEHIRAHTIGLASTTAGEKADPCEALCTSTVQSFPSNSEYSTESSASFQSIFQPRQDSGAEKSVTNLLSALESEVDKLHAQFVKFSNHKQVIGESQLQAQQLVPSQVKQLATKLEQVASLEAPHLARHRETILALRKKVALLSENADFVGSWRSGLNLSMEIPAIAGEMNTFITYRTEKQRHSGGDVPEFPQDTGSWSTMSEDKASWGDEVGQASGFGDPARWSTSEEATRFLAEVEHLMKSTPQKYEASTFSADLDHEYDQEQLQDEPQAAGIDMCEQVARLSAEMQDILVTDEKDVESFCGVDSAAVVRTSLRDQEGDTTTGSFGRFVFDMEQDNEAVMLKKGDSNNGSYRCSRLAERRAGSAPGALSPFSKMMAKLDLLNSSMTVPLTDSLVVAERVERSIGSLESAFEKALGNNSNNNVPELCSPFKFSVTSSSSNNNSSSKISSLKEQ